MELNQVRTIVKSQGIHLDPLWNGALAVKVSDIDGLALLDELIRRGMHLSIYLLTEQNSEPVTFSILASALPNSLNEAAGNSTNLQHISAKSPAIQNEEKRTEVKGNIQFSGEAANDSLREFRGISASARLAMLTVREKEVMRRVLDGLTSKEIGAALGISFRTVENYRAQIKQKTGCSNLLQLSRLLAYKVAQ